MEFKNDSGLEFTDISSEEYRQYTFENATVKIANPLRLNVSASGGHRIFDQNGNSHYIPQGWIHLMWRAKTNEAHFVK